ncbi:hypothetical protein [Salinisphaera sp. S4-8]|uniref:hypothetical protein n=1 Tax=Salinisphaera sp. S4-8 TaxID=633357 RepID=UPI00333E513C
MSGFTKWYRPVPVKLQRNTSTIDANGYATAAQSLRPDNECMQKACRKTAVHCDPAHGSGMVSNRQTAFVDPTANLSSGGTLVF